MHVQGLRELERALADLKKSTAKNALRGAAKDALEPMRAHAEAQAPHEFGDLAMAIAVSEQRTPAASRKTRAVWTSLGFRSARSEGIKMAMGPTRGKGVLHYAGFQEFGTSQMPPQPYMRPAWDAQARPTVDRLATALWTRIKKAAARAEKKRLKAAAAK